MLDFSTVTDGKLKASEVIAKSGLAIAAKHAFDALDAGTSFPAATDFVQAVRTRLDAKTASTEAKYGVDAVK